MNGWRARIGIIVPSGNQTLEPELTRAGPPGVAFHFTRILNVVDTEDELDAMAAAAPRAAVLLAHAHVDLIAFGCTAGSLLRGADYDIHIAKAITAASSAPATTTSSCVVAALRSFRAHRVAVVTPYASWLNDRVAAFMEAAGFSIAGLATIPEAASPDAIPHIPPEATYRAARAMASNQIDALFLSCTDLPTAGVVDALEADLGCPVVTSNQATLWGSLRLAGVRHRIGGWGQLLEGRDRNGLRAGASVM